MEAFTQLYDTICARRDTHEEGSYTAYLFDQGLEKICKKVGEESGEVIIAAMKHNRQELTNEICDEIYHLFVLMAHCEIPLNEIEAELAKRSKRTNNRKAERKKIVHY